MGLKNIAFASPAASYLRWVPEWYMRTELEAVEPSAGTLARAARGDAQAFAELVRRHQHLVFSVAWHFFNDRALAEDVAQEVFLQLFHGLGGIESDTHLVLWLRRVTVRKCIDYARWRQRQQALALAATASLSSETRHSDCLELDQLRRLVAALPAKLRAVVTLRYQEDMEPSQIAQVLGCPVNSVKSRLQRALALLRRRLGA